MYSLDQYVAFAGLLDRAKRIPPSSRDTRLAGELAAEVGKSMLPDFLCRRLLDEISRRNGTFVRDKFQAQRGSYPPVKHDPSQDVADVLVIKGVGYDLNAWREALPDTFDLPALMADKGLTRNTEEPADDEGTGVYAMCPHQGVHDDDDEEVFAYCGSGDEEEKVKLSCEGSETCAGLSAEPLDLLAGYLEKGLITVADLEAAKYGGVLVPTVGAFEEPVGYLDFLEDGFVYDDASFYTVDAKDGVGHPHFACAHLEVLAKAQNEKGEHIGYKIAFKNQYDRREEEILTETQLASEGSALFARLREAGLKIADDPRGKAAFRKLLATWSFGDEGPAPVVTLLSRPGWHGEIFVCPTGEIVGTTVGDRQLNPDVVTEDTSKAGSEEGWFNRVSISSWSGRTPQFALGILQSVSGVISSRYGGENAGRYFGGSTSHGKTTSQTIGASCVANPAPRKGVLITAKATEEERALARTRAYGTCLHIDEAKNAVERKFVERLAYDARDWEGTPYTLSGVKPVHEWVEKGGGDTGEGIETRLLPVDVTKLPLIAPADVGAMALAATENYGWVLPSFVEEVIEQGLHQDQGALRKRVDDYAAQLTDASDADAYRASKHFGILWLVGELLKAAGCVPDDGDVEGVVRWAWDEWQASRGFVRRAAAEAVEGRSEVERSIRRHRQARGPEPREIATCAHAAIDRRADAHLVAVYRRGIGFRRRRRCRLPEDRSDRRCPWAVRDAAPTDQSAA